MGEIFTGLLFVIGVFVAPVIAFGWLVYRLFRGSRGDDYSIK